MTEKTKFQYVLWSAFHSNEKSSNFGCYIKWNGPFRFGQNGIFGTSFEGTRALSIQQKFRFEISEILRVKWNGSFRLHRPDPSHRALGYCSCKQDTKERYWGQQFCQMERNISVQPTEMTRPVKEDHLQSWSRKFRSDQTEMVRSI